MPAEAVAPGTYRGRVVVTPADAPAAELPVSVRVRRFTLPRSPRMKTAFAMMDGFTRATYGEITPALRRQCLDLMLSHRLNPDDISRTDPPDVADLLYARDHGLTAFNILNLVPKPQGQSTLDLLRRVEGLPGGFQRGPGSTAGRLYSGAAQARVVEDGVLLWLR